jgi:hypothetical protein
MSRDLELPNGYQDADLQQSALERAGAKSAALRRRGICDHGWLMAPDGEPARCLHCGAVFADAEAAYEARREARS